jgi:hypothetical protein
MLRAEPKGMNMNATHTPGPWHRGTWHGDYITARPSNSCDDRERTVARGISNGADLALIAAAPDLLAALEALVADFDASVITTCPMLVAARAAIAKAKGVQP